MQSSSEVPEETTGAGMKTLKGLEWTGLQRRHTGGRQAHGELLAVLSRQGDADRDYSETTSHPLGWLPAGKMENS